jgi:hypothetical protein
MDPVAPPTSTDSVDVDSATWHLAGEGDVETTGDVAQPAAPAETDTTTSSPSALAVGLTAS